MTCHGGEHHDGLFNNLSTKATLHYNPSNSIKEVIHESEANYEDIE